jgi:hypothetical protein
MDFGSIVFLGSVVAAGLMIALPVLAARRRRRRGDGAS